MILLLTIFRFKLNKYSWFLIVLFLAIAIFFHFSRILLLKDIDKKIQSSGFKINLGSNSSSNNSPTITENEIKLIAEKVTVRIFFDDNNSSIGGSGVIIYQKDNNYFVITNNHVVKEENINYSIATYKGKIYLAEVIKRNNHNYQENDLALLKFTSKENYPMINVSQQSLKENQIVFSTGFSFQKNLEQSKELNYTKGNLIMILNKPLIGGYQLGYTNLVHNGMSGGSIINQKGELIGINGLGKYPIFGNPYIYQDGVKIDEKQAEKMSELSWGITIESIKNFIKNNEKIKDD
ncbi:serine protease [Geminocystis sp. NIES-3709]|uniref:S1 family peptidase n=1 Tax=Geminocystis sp. NIES-3709 TaxID=1617448 RepID=UPI0005FCC9A3|nr:serine protease [Geminocystis sp. NIES-3709]BAQ66249.1 hypothetical protein GM3709_3014 [Geminocystis sp. NIES-3709]